MPEIARDARLVVPGEARQAAREIGPLAEAAPPPGVVFRAGVERRQIEGERPGAARRRWRQRPHRLEIRARLAEAAHLARNGGFVRRQNGAEARPVTVAQEMQQRIFIERAVEM